jgi:hypothetical protein
MRPLTAALAAALLCFAAAAPAQEAKIGGNDSIESVVAAHKGKRVTLRLRSGQELTGVVRDATKDLAVLGELSGREFFDAVVDLDAVEAVIVRTRSR